MADLTNMNIAAIILAAGSSSRLGRSKQLLKIEGESLVCRGARAAIEANCRPVIVVTGSGHEHVVVELNQLPVKIVFNPNWENGIGSSIRAGINALIQLHPNIEGAAILVCDQPRLDARVLTGLLETWLAKSTPMAACEYSGILGPPCCFARAKFADLLQLNGHDGAKQVLLADPSAIARFQWPDGTIDLDTEDDLLALQTPNWPSICNQKKTLVGP